MENLMITCPEAREKLRSGAILVDVRQPDEFQRGALPDAINVPLGNIMGAANQFNRDTQLVLYCNSGQRSAQARLVLNALGLKTVFDAGSYRNLMNC